MPLLNNKITYRDAAAPLYRETTLLEDSRLWIDCLYTLDFIPVAVVDTFIACCAVYL